MMWQNRLQCLSLACLFMVVLYKSEQFDISSTDISSRVIFSTMAVVNECGIILKVGLDEM